MLNDALPEEKEIAALASLRVVADSQRHQILSLLIAEPLTAAEVARRLRVNRTRVYYHLDLLQKHGLIEVVGQRQVAAVMERTYRATAQTFRVNRKLLAATAGAKALARTEATLIESIAVDARTAADPDIWVGRAYIRLTEANARKLLAEMQAVLDKYRKRPSKNGRTYQVGMTLFAMREEKP
jgi:DNA-binding transcriptional ArsR family regulator